MTGSTEPLVAITGGTHSIGTNFNTGLFTITGVGTKLSLLKGSLPASQAGGLLALSGAATLTSGRDVVALFAGATLTSETSKPLIQLTNSSLKTGTPTSTGRVLVLFAGSSVSLKGPLLSASSLTSTVSEREY